MRTNRAIIILISITFLFSIHFFIPAQVNAQEVIKIGGIGPLSAPGGVESGEAIKGGMEIAVEKINAEGGARKKDPTYHW